MSAGPFAQLVQCATQRRQVRRATRASYESSSATGGLLHLLDCNGPMTSAELADAQFLTTRKVWGLLKNARSIGQVTHRDGLWALDVDFPGTDVLKAAALLRARGWTVEAPR